MTRTGEFKLQRQKGGVGYFGQVRVRVVPGEADVVWAVPPEDRTSLQPRHDAEFVEAAVAGAREGVELVRSLGVDVARVEVVHAQLNVTDIEESAVRAAAALAVGEAFGVADRLVLTFDGGWRATTA
ncbi:hypothetical protein FHX82_001546 [Amycolatopsis bartoniae]|uniref:Uncharacterized protein n=1 Tax=Amycolatopsis bartoniae TaxID=941986 RepID=A0A8H9IXK8_9PSEU|nr:hypothetical protein [Amycolatopsis bartoniae]MBB2934526.1 hypothetical protein [Amycolatopsis bartoniae]TVS99060.1 hypothetical protein FNH07_35950 [Amycolatopsis bartoniae]GHF46726.1 hypothetical protein GCM10017566_19820 [Amycolatopsis bartoniae]